LAARATGDTLPNPVVGCVLLTPGGEPIAEGWHERPGGPHAEVVALRQAGSRAAGATAVVTLEPCAHTGRTRPCTDALIAAGVRRVLVAVRDPWPTASGGAERLRASGIEVEVGLLADEATAVNEPWLVAVRRGRPFVTWLVRSSLDGRGAAADGSRGLTGATSAADVRRLHSEMDTVLLGRDSPSDAAAAPTRRVLLEVRADPSDDLADLLSALYRRDRRHVLLDADPRLAGAMVAAGLVDRMVAYLEPALLGAGPSVLDSDAVTTIGEAWRWRIRQAGQMGSDVRIVAVP
jgi:diaminohydroxyphosphoribosylaminopyrimidine deaminase/5-amino-6-(5-phosphoribosylamino)uracil reductase